MTAAVETAFCPPWCITHGGEPHDLHEQADTHTPTADGGQVPVSAWISATSLGVQVGGKFLTPASTRHLIEQLTACADLVCATVEHEALREAGLIP